MSEFWASIEGGADPRNCGSCWACTGKNVCRYCGLNLQPSPLPADNAVFITWVSLWEGKLCQHRPRQWGLFRRGHVPK